MHEQLEQPDFIFENHGSLYLVTPQHEDAREHLADNVADEALWHGKALVVEPRYAFGLAEALHENGYTVEL